MLLNLAKTITETLSQDVIFYIFSGLIFVVFSVFSVLKIFFGKQYKRGYAISVISIVLSESALTFSSGVSVLFYDVLTVIAALILYLPFSLLKEKKISVYPAQREFIKYIDGEIKKERESIKTNEYETIKEEPFCISKIAVKPVAERKINEKEVDFTHVKNVIERLSYYDLSPTDKKQIKNLSETVALAENYGYDADLKRKINDGLGILLKIMSKYKV